MKAAYFSTCASPNDCFQPWDEMSSSLSTLPYFETRMSDFSVLECTVLATVDDFCLDVFPWMWRKENMGVIARVFQPWRNAAGSLFFLPNEVSETSKEFMVWIWETLQLHSLLCRVLQRMGASRICRSLLSVTYLPLLLQLPMARTMLLPRASW